MFSLATFNHEPGPRSAGRDPTPLHPMALRSGLSLFPDLSEPMDLKLLSTTIFGAGAVAHVYQPA
jgi:hypothetical protein